MKWIAEFAVGYIQFTKYKKDKEKLSRQGRYAGEGVDMEQKGDPPRLLLGGGGRDEYRDTDDFCRRQRPSSEWLG